MSDEMYTPIPSNELTQITLRVLDQVLPDHDMLTRLDQTIRVDHEALKLAVSDLTRKAITRDEHGTLVTRVAALEQHAARASGMSTVIIALVGIAGIIIGAVLQHTWR